ncbi:hypothetical protein FRB91_005251 [Serendipita sp. 411]|nr:hypothetical protein FRB91_005251 [Serendipita sp. 411]
MATKLVSMNTENTKNEVILPQITVQHDITTVMNDVRDGVVADGWEDAWISCYFEGKPSVHGKLRITRISGGLSYEARDGVGWHGTSSADFRVSCASLKIEPTLIRLPKHVYIVAETQRFGTSVRTLLDKRLDGPQIEWAAYEPLDGPSREARTMGDRGTRVPRQILSVSISTSNTRRKTSHAGPYK